MSNIVVKKFSSFPSEETCKFCAERPEVHGGFVKFTQENTEEWRI